MCIRDSMLAAPNSSDNVHLKMLSTLAMNLMDEDFRSGLINACLLYTSNAPTTFKMIPMVTTI